MASLVKQDGLFYAQFYSPDSQPQRKRVPLRTRTRRTAEQVKRQMEDAWATGDFDPWRPKAAPAEMPATTPDPAPDTVEAAAVAFYESRSHRTLRTRQTYADIVGRFVGSLPQGSPVRGLTPAHVVRWLDSTDARDVARRTYTKHLSTFFRFCVGEGWMDADVTAGVKLKRIPKRFPKALTPADVQAVLDAVKREGGSSAWIGDVITVGVHTALRRGEIVSLRWAAVDLEGRMLTVACTDDFETKSGKERRIPLSDAALAVLSRLHRDRRPDPQSHVFQHTRGPVNGDYLGHVFTKFTRKAKLPDVGIHALRHTALSWLAMKGVPVPVMQRFAGHADIKTTMLYCHVAQDVYADAITRAFA